MPEHVYFIILNSAVKEKVACDLAENCYLTHKRVVILVEDQTRGIQVDKLLWIWKQHSFVPHLYTDTLSESFTEPVIITPHVDVNTGYDTLLAMKPAEKSITDQFATVIDFAEKYDEHQLQLSRERFKEYKERNITVSSMQPGEFLHSAST